MAVALLVWVCRWRGSIYKLLWRDFIAFAFIYYALNFSYRFLMNESQQALVINLYQFIHISCSCLLD